MAQKPSEYINWSFGEGEQANSYNVNVLSKLSPKQIAEQHPTYFQQYGEEARKIRIEALHGAIMDAKAAYDKAHAPAPVEAPEEPAKKK